VPIDPKISRATRDLFDAATSGELEKIPSIMDSLSEGERGMCLQLSVLTSAHVTLALINNQWPNEATLRQVSKNLANAKLKVALDEEDVYAFLVRVVFGFEPIERVFPDLAKAFMLTVLISANLLLVCCPQDKTIWRYMDEIENAVDVATSLPQHAIPSVVYRSRVPSQG
jgi:hypothetical protein